MAITGATGAGKTMFIVGQACETFGHNPAEGGAIIDPHDTLAMTFMQCVHESRLEDVIYHDPMDNDYVL